MGAIDSSNPVIAILEYFVFLGGNMRLENKVALISGGARGMGAVEARMFAQEGAKVVIGDLLEEEGKRTEAAIN